LSTEAFDRRPKVAPPMGEIAATPMAPPDAFEVSPSPPTGLQPGRLGRAPRQGEAVRRAGPQRRPGPATAVEGSPLPEDHPAPRPLPPQLRQQGDPRPPRGAHAPGRRKPASLRARGREGADVPRHAGGL
jgi:hypothetical protein